MQKTASRINDKKIVETHSEELALVKKNILGVRVTDASQETILEYIIKTIKNLAKPYYIVTPNPEMIVLASRNPAFQTILNNAKLALNDGVGVGLAARIMGISLHGRFTGIELVEKLCEKSNDWPITVGFLGGEPNVAEKASECLIRRFPKLRVAFVGQEWPQNYGKKIDILFVALGAPKQEFWMVERVGKIPVKVMVGVGGAFDQIVNPSLRPPKSLQNVGLGWLYRLIRQPWRWKRQLALLEFILLLGKEKFKK